MERQAVLRFDVTEVRLVTTAAPQLRPIRVAVYARASVARDLEFDSVTAQVEAISAYVASQRSSGWVLLPVAYIDDGYSGGDVDRPSFQRLIADVEAGKVDAIGCYKLDRVSRSLFDFARIIEALDKRGVALFSVTQQFSTQTSLGKLTLGILMSFAQFERETIAERIRDKMQATRRRGAWTGGRPILGYDVVGKKLVVNRDEAAQVLATFQLYRERRTLRATVAELGRRGWRNKTFTTKKGETATGSVFTNTSLYCLLTNVLYTGRVRAGDDLVAGAQEAIVDNDLWSAVQQQLRNNGHDGGSEKRNKCGALLRGILRCARCGSSMTHAFSTRGGKRHRYYICTKLNSEGPEACPGARVPAGKFEAFVANQIRAIGTDEELLARTAEAVERRAAERQDQLDAELRRGERDRQRLETDQERGVDVRDQLRTLAARLDEARAEREALGLVTEASLRGALASFTPVWEHLFPNERERILRLLIQQITYDPDTGEADIDLQPAGITVLAREAGSSR
jgi:site-specific DNA recombinase